MNAFNFKQQNLKGMRILIRADLNLPLDEDGQFASMERMKAALPTIQYALEAGAYVMVMSHFGRPTEGNSQPHYSLAALVNPLSQALNVPVDFVSDYLENIPTAQKNRVMLLENVRFNVGESSDDPELARRYAELCDIFVLDAYAVIHRKQASVSGICEYAPAVTAGLLLEKEIEAVEKLEAAQSPFLVILGGSKLKTKLPIIQKLSSMADRFIFGGGIANTFLAAQGIEVGQSLYEKEFIPQAQQILKKITMQPIKDLIVLSHEADGGSKYCHRHLHELKASDEICDLGPITVNECLEHVNSSQTILWNGPVGRFEISECAVATKCFVRAISHCRAFSLAGGGETISAIEKYQNGQDHFSYCSSGGGAFLAHLAGMPLPGFEALHTRLKKDLKND